jgi:hypothetical protein
MEEILWRKKLRMDGFWREMNEVGTECKLTETAIKEAT